MASNVAARALTAVRLSPEALARLPDVVRGPLLSDSDLELLLSCIMIWRNISVLLVADEVYILQCISHEIAIGSYETYREPVLLSGSRKLLILA